MTNTSPEQDRLQELLADQALFGLPTEEEKELEILLAKHPEVDRESLQLLAAELETGGLAVDADRMEIAALPVGLADRIRADFPGAGRSESFSISSLRTTGESAQAGLETNSLPPEQTNTNSSSNSIPPIAHRRSNPISLLFAVSGWLTAAVLFVALVFPEAFSPVQTAEQLRANLLTSSAPLFQKDWSTTEDVSAAKATGDIVWNQTGQQGFMTFRGLEVNDPNRSQYQLWIFDRDQDDPIDGGVFDMPSSSSEVVIPIDAKLKVSRPHMFAVTVEKPGGVVKSKKERIVVLAKME